jgi:hypothetical protein
MSTPTERLYELLDELWLSDLQELPRGEIAQRRDRLVHWKDLCTWALRPDSGSPTP